MPAHAHASAFVAPQARASRPELLLTNKRCHCAPVTSASLLTATRTRQHPEKAAADIADTATVSRTSGHCTHHKARIALQLQNSFQQRVHHSLGPGRWQNLLTQPDADFAVSYRSIFVF